MQRSYTESWRSAREVPKPKSKLRGPMTNGLRASAPVIRSDLRVWQLFSHSIDAAVDEIKRVAARGAVRGVEIANTHD